MPRGKGIREVRAMNFFRPEPEFADNFLGARSPIN